GAVRLAFEKAAGSTALVLNGDTWCPFDLVELEDAHRRSGALVTMWLAPADADSRYGRVAVGADGRVRDFAEKAESGGGLVNAGIYLVERRALPEPVGAPFSLERDVLPTLVDGRLDAVSGRAALLD